VTDVTDPRVAGRVLRDDRGGAVGGRIVADEDDEVLDGLVEQRIERRRQKALAVVDGNTDGDEGRPGRGHHRAPPIFRA
jgi:hypothetical protein